MSQESNHKYASVVDLKDNTAVLMDWYLVGPNLKGTVYRDASKRWCDGTPIRTSILLSRPENLQEGAVALTKYSKYLLGPAHGGTERTPAQSAAFDFKLARIAYEAYCETTNWKSAVTGAQLPDFLDCPAAVQNGWIAAASAINTEVAGY